MKEKFSNAHPIIASILWTLLILLVTFFAGMISFVAEISSNSTMLCGFILLTVVVALYMHNTGGLKEYGFHNLTKSIKENKIYCLLLFAIGLSTLTAGISNELTLSSIIYAIIFMMAVSFVEESLFRGIILKYLLKKGKWFAIIISSVLFGFAHIINLMSGQNLADTITQVLFALLIGFVLAEFALITKSIFPCILFHFINNVSSNISKQDVSYEFVIECIVLMCIIVLSWFLIPKVNALRSDLSLK